MASSPYLTVHEAAEFARVDQKTIRRAITDGRLRAFKPVRKILIREADVLAWVEGHPAAAQPDLKARPRERAAPPRRDGVGSVSQLRAMDRDAG